MARVPALLRSHPVLAFVAVGLAGAGLLLVALAAWLLPGLVPRAAEERLQARVTVPVRIERVNLNLFTGRARVSNILVGAVGGGPPILALPALDLQVSYRGLLRGRLVLRYLTFDRPRVFVERTGPESVNVLQMLRPSDGGAATPVTVEQVSLRGGTVTFVDRTQTPAFERTFTDVGATVGYLSSLPEFRFTPTSFELRIGIGRGALTVTGNTAPFARPGGLELVARMDGLEPGLLRGYLPLRVRVDLRGSRVDGEVHYRLAYRGGEVVENALDARVETGPVRFLPPDDDTPLVSLAGLVGRDIHADFVANRIRLGNVVVRELHAKLVRGPAGLNLTQLIALEPEAGAPAGLPPAPSETRQAAPPADPRPPLAVLLGRVRAEGGSLEFSDHTTTPVVSTTLRGIGLRLQDVSVGPAAKPGRLEGEAGVEGGSVRFDGTVEGGTLATRVRLRANRVGLQPFRPYVEPALRGASARGGLLDASLDAVLASRDPAGPRLDLAGTAEVREVALALPGAREPTVTAGRLAVDLARLRVLPAFQADVTRVRLVGAALRVRRERDGSLDLQRWWAQPTAPPPAQVAEPTGGSRAVTLRRIELVGCRLDFTDASVSPAFTASLRDVGADVRQSPQDPDRMAVRLRGRLGDASPVELDGWVTPFAAALRAQVKGAIRDYDLPTLNPYVTQYVGQRIERGRITTEVAGSYDGGSYTADTLITIRHVRSGSRKRSRRRRRCPTNRWSPCTGTRAGRPRSRPPPAEEMKQFVLDHMRIGPEDLTDLAAQRARVIQETLVRRGVQARRLYVGRAEDRAVQDGGPGRVEFELLY